MSELNGMDTREASLQKMDELIKYFSIKQKQYDEYDYESEQIYRLSSESSKAALIWGILVSVASILLSLLTQDGSWLLLLLLGGGLIGLYVFLQVRKKHKLTEATNRYYELGDELIEHYRKYPHCPVGAQYTNPSNLMVIKSTIYSGRADLIKEALNILEQDAHRARMEDIASQTAEYARQAAVNTESIRRDASVTAVFTAANFFKLNDINKKL